MLGSILLFILLTTSTQAEEICDRALKPSYIEAIQELAQGYLALESMRVESGSKGAAEIVFKKALEEKKKFFIEKLGAAQFELLFEEAKNHVAKKKQISAAHRVRVRQQAVKAQVELGVWELEKTLTVSGLKHLSTIRLSPDKKLALTTSVEGIPNNFQKYYVRVWDLEKGQQIYQLPGDVIRSEDVNFSPDGNWIVMTNERSRIPILYNARTGEKETQLTRRNGRLTSMAFSPDGRYLVTGTDKTTIYITDLTTKKHRVISFAKSGVVNVIRTIVFSADGAFFSTSSSDTHLRFWDMANLEEIHDMTMGFDSSQFSADGKYYYIFRSGDLQMRRVEDHSLVHSLEVKGWALSNHAVSEDNTRAVFSINGTIHMNDLSTGQELYQFKGHGNWKITAMKFTPDGQYVVSGDQGGRIIIWRVSDGVEQQSFTEERSVADILMVGNDLFYSLSNSKIYIWKRKSTEAE